MSTPTNLREQLQRDESYRPTPYRDPIGLWTVGFGWCLERRPMSLRAAEFVLDEQISETSAEVIATYPWMRTIGEIRLGAFVNMAFNVGVAGLKKSPKMLLAAEAGNWELAASELLDGVYHKQVGIRAERLANQLRTGEWK